MTGDVKYSYANKLGKAAAKAVIEEAMAAPKPGLVDPLGQGCHLDMDLMTFIRSAEAIAPYWERQALIGLNGTEPEHSLGKLRAIGIEMENAMFLATKGINTHKGLIYLMSLLLYGTGFCIHMGIETKPENIVLFASKAVKGSIERELFPLKYNTDNKTMTHGEKLFIAHGITGIRGEAERGFPSMMHYGLPEMIRVNALGASNNNSLLCSLLAIMESNEDSNVIHRGGYDFWSGKYKELVLETKSHFNPLCTEYSALRKLEDSFLKLRISPGGAADLLSCTIYIFNMTKSTCQQ